MGYFLMLDEYWKVGIFMLVLVGLAVVLYFLLFCVEKIIIKLYKFFLDKRKQKIVKNANRQMRGIRNYLNHKKWIETYKTAERIKK